MEAKLLGQRMTQPKGQQMRTGTAVYERSEWHGQNESGFTPMADKVLILVDRVASRTAGGIDLIEDIQEKANLAAESGVVVALGTEAFRYDSQGRVWKGLRPQPGTHAFFERYAGQVMHGRDGNIYRVMDDRCIGAVNTDEADASAIEGNAA